MLVLVSIFPRTNNRVEQYMSEINPTYQAILDAACDDCPFANGLVEELQLLRTVAKSNRIAARQIPIFEGEGERFLNIFDDYQCPGPEEGVDSPSGCPAYMKSKGIEIPRAKDN